MPSPDKPPADKGGSPPTVARGAGAEAGDLWRRGRYGECARLLEELSEQAGGDWKVRANLAAARALQGAAGLEQAAQQQAAAAEAAGSLPDSILLLLNTAAVLVNSQQLPAAAKLLEPAWHFLRGSPEAAVADEAALGVCLLLLEVSMALGAFAQAAGIVAWLEQRFELGGVSEDGEDCGGGGSSARGTPEGPAQQQREGSEHSCDSAQVSPSARRWVEQAGKTVAGHSLPQLLLGARARLHLAAGDARRAKRDTRCLLALDPRQPQALALKAELEAARGNLRRAAKLVAARAEEGAALPPAERAAALANMGCVQHCEGRRNAAALCFAAARAAAAEQPPPLLPAEAPRAVQLRAEHAPAAAASIAYNQGLTALQRGECAVALSCFQACLPALESSPVLWLRMAESCCEAASQGSAPGDGGQQTLRLGQQAAARAAELFAAQLAGLGESHGNGNGTTHSPGGSAALASVLASQQREQCAGGRLAALCAEAFLRLHLGEAEPALAAAGSLLKEAAPASAEWQLGQAYAAEALTQLGRAPAAAEALQAALAQLVDQPPLASRAPAEEAAGASAAEASDPRHRLLVNLASTYLSLADHTQAQEFARAGAEDCDSREALLMHAYVQLCQGQTGAALAQLRAAQLGA